MVYFGEKFIEKKIEGNKIIRISEFKEFVGDYDGLVTDINDCITDDWENLIDNYGILFDRSEEFYCIDCDMAYDSLLQYIEDDKENYATEKEYYEDNRDWREELALLKNAKGFTVYLTRNSKLYSEDFKNV